MKKKTKKKEKKEKKAKIPFWTLKLNLAFFKAGDAEKAQGIIMDCLNKKFKGIKFMVLPGYHPHEAALNFHPNDLALKG